MEVQGSAPSDLRGSRGRKGEERRGQEQRKGRGKDRSRHITPALALLESAAESHTYLERTALGTEKARVRRQIKKQ